MEPESTAWKTPRKQKIPTRQYASTNRYSMMLMPVVGVGHGGRAGERTERTGGRPPKRSAIGQQCP